MKKGSSVIKPIIGQLCAYNEIVTHDGSTKAKRAGFTLLEIMVACIVLSILAIGGMAYSFHASRIISQGADIRTALVLANRRMELIKSTPYSQFTTSQNGITIGSDYIFLGNYNPLTDTFVRYNTNPNESIQINSKTGAIRTRVRFVNTATPGNAVASTCLEAEVVVQYGTDPNHRIYLIDHHVL